MRSMNASQLNKRTATILAVAILALAVGGGSALAGDEINESGQASENGIVYIENLAGSIKVKGWNKDRVEVTGTLDEKAKRLDFEAGGKKTIIEVVYPRRVKNVHEGSHLVVMVPHNSRLAIECVSADIDISGVLGSIHTETVSGDVDLEKVGEEVLVECVSGTVRASGDESSVNVEVVSGDVVLDFDRFLDLAVEAVSGSIEITGDLDSRGSFELDVHSGSITLTVPADVSARFEASSFNGEINTDFGYEANRTSRYLPGQELEFSVGGGDADVEINTFSGEIYIKKQ
jgi:DUF4097 and DUF4098 domain-containing protein YvlB